MTVLLAPLARQVFLNPSTGAPFAGGYLYTFAAGTTSDLATFTDSTGTVQNANPIILDADGSCEIWLTPQLGYKFALAYSTDTNPPTNPLWVVDNIFGSPVNATLSPWAIATGTGDAIVAAYSPPNTALGASQDGLLLAFRAPGANATATPTFTPDGLPTYVITDEGEQALIAGAIPGANAECLVRFNFPNSTWELLNPSPIAGPTKQSTIAAASGTTDIGSAPSSNILVTGSGKTITALGSSASVNSPIYTVTFQGINTLVSSNSGSPYLSLPDNQNITTGNGDYGVFQYQGSGNWICSSYQYANGRAVAMSGPTNSLASAATTDLGKAASNSVVITGTTTITAFGSSASLANPIYFLKFSGAILLTYNGTSLILPGAQDITTAAGDTSEVEYLGTGNWIVRRYTPGNGIGNYMPITGSLTGASSYSVALPNLNSAGNNRYNIEVFLTPGANSQAAWLQFAAGASLVSAGYSYTLQTSATNASNPSTLGDGSAAKIIMSGTECDSGLVSPFIIEIVQFTSALAQVMFRGLCWPVSGIAGQVSGAGFLASASLDHFVISLSGGGNFDMTYAIYQLPHV